MTRDPFTFTTAELVAALRAIDPTILQSVLLAAPVIVAAADRLEAYITHDHENPEDNELGRLAVGFDPATNEFALVTMDRHNRPIACCFVNGTQLAAAIGALAPVTGNVPSIDAYFHVHTLKELIA